MLSRGLALPSDLSRRAGVSRQLVLQWARSADVDWRAAREKKLNKDWHNALKQDRPRKPTKAALRRIANKAKRDWDKRNDNLQT